MSKKNNLDRQIENAKYSLSNLCQAAPYLSPQYVEMCSAEQKLKQAQEEYDEKKAKWDKMKDGK